MCVGKNSEQREAVPTAAFPVLYLPYKTYQTLESHAGFFFCVYVLFHTEPIGILDFYFRPLFYVTPIHQKMPLREAFFFHEDCRIFD